MVPRRPDESVLQSRHASLLSPGIKRPEQFTALTKSDPVEQNSLLQRCSHSLHAGHLPPLLDDGAKMLLQH
jgi:hypothetical protein